MIKTHWTFQQAHQFFLWYRLLQWWLVSHLFIELRHLEPSLSSSHCEVHHHLQARTQHKVGGIKNTTKLIVLELLVISKIDSLYI